MFGVICGAGSAAPAVGVPLLVPLLLMTTSSAVSPASIGVLGSSAGGNLVMLVGTSGVGDGHPPVKAVASWSGPSDLATVAITNVSGDELVSPSTVPIPGADVPPGCTGQVDTCIILRTALFKDGMMYVQGGGGVVADSDPDAEYDETLHKTRALRRAAEEAWRFA